jgi:hypothetical protein
MDPKVTLKRRAGVISTDESPEIDERGVERGESPRTECAICSQLPPKAERVHGGESSSEYVVSVDSPLPPAFEEAGRECALYDLTRDLEIICREKEGDLKHLERYYGGPCCGEILLSGSSTSFTLAGDICKR